MFIEKIIFVKWMERQIHIILRIKINILTKNKKIN